MTPAGISGDGPLGGVRTHSVAERAAWMLLCLFVFTIPWEKGVWVGSVGTIARTAGIAAFAAGLIAVVQRRRLRPPNLALGTAAVFVIWCALTWLWSVDPGATVARTLTLAQLLAMMWLIWEFCFTRLRQQQLLAMFVMGAVAGAGITFIRYFLDMQTYYRRYAATGFDPNTFGLILALAVPLAFWLALRTKGNTRWLWYIAILLLIAAVILTASRSALISTFLGFLFPLRLWKQSSVRDRIAAALLLGFLVLSLFQFAPAASRSRLATIPTEIASGSFNSRKQIWKSGILAWFERPIAGVGAGAYPEAVVPWLGRPTKPGVMNVAHNTFLSVLVEGGLVGFAIYGTLLGVLLVYVWMMSGHERVLWAVLLAAWAAGVSTLTWEQHKVTWLLFSCIPTAWVRSWLPFNDEP